LPQFDPRPRGFSLVSSLQTKAIHFIQDLCLTSFREIEASNQVVTFGAIISSCEKGLQWAAALYLFHEMSRIQIAPNHISYNAAISSCEKGPCVFL
jgi:pentatricopeptide repeat protein